MPGSFFEHLFGCPHRRMTRPITPVSKPGVPSGETYVVCLDCGKQFAYDWDHMRIGMPIVPSRDSGVLHHDMQKPSTRKLKYAFLGSAIPLGVVLGAVLFTKPRNKHRAASKRGEAPSPIGEAGVETVEGPDHDIALPHGGPGARFSVRQLIDYIRQAGRDYIIQGQIQCVLADHRKPSSLDCWLRENFARNKDTMQATDEVIAQLVRTGLFEEIPNLPCPDSGEPCKGIRLVRRP